MIKNDATEIVYRVFKYKNLYFICCYENKIQTSLWYVIKNRTNEYETLMLFHTNGYLLSLGKKR
jgi:hypothetical protein